MNDFFILVVGILCMAFGASVGYGTGRDVGRVEACKTVEAEWYQTECVIVKRKKVEL